MDLAKSPRAPYGRSAAPPRPAPGGAYRRLLRAEADRGGAALEDEWESELVRGALAVRDEASGLFLAFAARGDFVAWCGALAPEARAFHEVVLGSRPQHLKFDVDAPAARLDELAPEFAAAEAAEAAELAALLGVASLAEPGGDSLPAGARRRRHAERAVDALIEAVLEEAAETWGAEPGGLAPARGDVAVAESSGPADPRDPEGPWKYSWHVHVVSWAVADAAEAAAFTARAIARLSRAAAALVDAGVNKRVQCFRLAASAKPGSRRPKIFSAGAAARFGTRAPCAACAAGGLCDDVFVAAAPGARVVPRAAARPPSAPAPAADERLVAAALAHAAARGALDGFVFVAARGGAGGLLTFRRVAPSRCAVCAETHRRDNSLLLAMSDAGGGVVALSARCRQAPGRSAPLGEFPLPPGAEPPAGPGPLQGNDPGRGPVAAALRAVAAGAPVHAASGWEALPAARRVEYDEPAMRDYALVPTLGVAAQMGLGKTKALVRWLGAHFPEGGVDPPVVRVVSFRRTFAAALARALPGFALYSDVQGGTGLLGPETPRLIVQSESLHRVRVGPGAAPDALVLDECESILAQFGSGLHRRFPAAWAAFVWLVRTARHVICLDANLGDRTLRVLERLRPGPERAPFLHWNRRRAAAGDTYFVTGDTGAWHAALLAAVAAGRRVVVPTNSLAEARAIAAVLRAEFPRRRVLAYSSETPAGERERDFGDVGAAWAGVDALVYTPTCSAGVSFEGPGFDDVFAWFTDASCDAETCRQMLGRVRDVSSRTYTVCLAVGPRRGLPDTAAAVRAALADARAPLARELADAAVSFSYDDDGRLVPYESDYFALWVESSAVANASRNDFARRFLFQVADTGAVVAPLAPCEDEADRSAALAGRAAARADHRAATAAAVAAAPELTDSAAAALCEGVAAGVELSRDDRASLAKWRLRRDFDWRGRAVDAGFVDAYDGDLPRRVFRALRAAAAAPDAPSLLARLRAEEALRFAAARGSAAAEARDLSRPYAAGAHELAVLALGCRGFALGGHPVVWGDAARARLLAAAPLLAARARAFAVEFPRAPLLRLPAGGGDELVVALSRTLDAVTAALYGVSVRRGVVWELRATPTGSLFTFLPAGADPASAPSPVVFSSLRPPPGDADGAVFLDAAFHDHAVARALGLPAPIAELAGDELAEGAAAPIPPPAVATRPRPRPRPRRPDHVKDGEGAVECSDSTDYLDAFAEQLAAQLAARERPAAC